MRSAPSLRPKKFWRSHQKLTAGSPRQRTERRYCDRLRRDRTSWMFRHPCRADCGPRDERLLDQAGAAVMTPADRSGWKLSRPRSGSLNAGTTARPIPCCWAARTITRVACAAVRQGVATPRPSRCCLRSPVFMSPSPARKRWPPPQPAAWCSARWQSPTSASGGTSGRALGDLISAETMKEIINKFHAAGHAAVRSGDPGHPDRMLMALALDTRARGFIDPDVGKIATFAIEAWDWILQDRRAARGQP